MRKSNSVRLRTPLWRRFVAALTMAAYFIVCTGLPVPYFVSQAAGSEIDASTPYPCQGHRCGCRSAEQCWKACCCMSEVDKRIWAERNGVALPHYLSSPPAAVVAQPAEHNIEPVGSCCKQSGRSPKKMNPCGAGSAEIIAKSAPAACEMKSDCALGQSPVAAVVPSNVGEPIAEQAANRVEWVSYFASQRCSGGATDVWLSGPTSLPVASCLVALARFEEVRPLAASFEPAAEATFSFPPHRPPRIV